MQFLYDPDAGASELTLTGENHKYLFKVRRFKSGEIVSLRNLTDSFIYRYEIVQIGRREAILRLKEKIQEQKRGGDLHLIWCVIDPKTIEKNLPMLNQLGVAQISFVYCDRSQKNFRIDLSRLKKILINSCQQCGRSDLMELEVLEKLDDAIENYSSFSVLDFGGVTEWGDIRQVLVGCEGGFSDQERQKLQNHQKLGLKTDLILKSETAALAITAKLLI
jgi:16S rRNA (uracil1498-N3)-methyltransferase